MEYNIYIDVFFLLNFVVNLCMLTGVGILFKYPLRIKRIFLAAVFASAINCVLLFVPITIFVGRICIATGMILFGFGMSQGDVFLTKLTALLFMAFATEGLLHFVSFPLAALSILLICHVIGRERKRKENECLVYVTFKDKTVMLQGFYDTGNRLEEPLTGRMVHIASYDAVKKILPIPYQQVVEAYFQTGILESTKVSRLQMYEFTFLSYHSIGKETGELLGIRMDTAVVLGNARKKVEEKAVIALTNQKELMKNHCQIIMNGRLEI